MGCVVATGVVVGRVAHLDVTAIKGLAVVDTERITVSDTGVLGNREFFFVEHDGRVYSVDVDSALLPYWSRYAPTTNRLAIGDSQGPILEEAVPVEGEVKEFDFFDCVATGRALRCRPMGCMGIIGRGTATRPGPQRLPRRRIRRLPADVPERSLTGSARIGSRRQTDRPATLSHADHVVRRRDGVRRGRLGRAVRNIGNLRRATGRPGPQMRWG